LSILFLNWFTDVASMTAWGNLFHSTPAPQVDWCEW